MVRAKPAVWFLMAIALLVMTGCTPVATPATSPATPGTEAAATAEPVATVLPTEEAAATVESVPTAEASPAGALNVTLTAEGGPFSSHGALIQLALTNNGDQSVYLPVCNRWELVTPDAPDRPMWGYDCEIDYLGHKVDPGHVFTDSLQVEIQPGTYHVVTRVYSDCVLGDPVAISGQETNYGRFSDCQTRQAVLSQAIEVVDELPESVNVTLTTDAPTYPPTRTQIGLNLTNQGDESVYLPICGPWEVIRPEEPDAPVWFNLCEVDYLGPEVEPGDTFTGTLELELEPGSYQGRIDVYATCTLEEPQIISESETYYGDFQDCIHHVEVLSAPFQVVTP
ncbi:MAG TPA: hypothetical protein VER55_00160 [Ardenticatenaceae bacterium]|nr:hypothetical protein [Ardenticatenaceae bacterium]